jgi:hypothetical protein
MAFFNSKQKDIFKTIIERTKIIYVIFFYKIYVTFYLQSLSIFYSLLQTYMFLT